MQGGTFSVERVTLATSVNYNFLLEAFPAVSEPLPELLCNVDWIHHRGDRPA